MDKDQADATARVVLDQPLSAQDAARRVMAERAARRIHQRRHGGLALAGFALGTALGLAVFEQFAFFGLAGAAVGYAVSQGCDRLRRRAPA